MSASSSYPGWIRGIFTNVLFVIGVILLIIAAVRGTSTAAKIIVFDKYPLDSWEEERCYQPQPVSVAEGAEVTTTTQQLSPEELEACLARLETQRQFRLVEDVSVTAALLASGAVLTFIFKQFIFMPRTKEKTMPSS